MIHVQANAVLNRYVLVYSDLASTEDAHEEVAQWAVHSGYRYSESPRRLSVFKGEKIEREWIILERDPAYLAPAPPRPCFKLHWHRAPKATPSPVK